MDNHYTDAETMQQSVDLFLGFFVKVTRLYALISMITITFCIIRNYHVARFRTSTLISYYIVITIGSEHYAE